MRRARRGGTAAAARSAGPRRGVRRPRGCGGTARRPEQKYTPEQIKREGLRRVNQEVLPEVGALMREGKFADAIEHLEESVAFASGAEERELLDALSCLTARCYLGMGRPKEALQGLNPALMQARRNGGPSAIKPHSIAAECFRALGDEEKTRVELRALVEAAAESADEAEQAGALLLAGIALFDMGDLHAAVPLLASAAAAAEEGGGLRGARRRARARRRRAAPVAAPGPSRGGVEGRAQGARGGRAPGKNERRRRDKRFRSARAAPTHALMARTSSPRRRVSRRRSASAPERRRRRSGPRRPRRASLKIHKKTERQSLRALAPVGDARARRCRAHGNLFTAHLLMGAREAAETHLAHACSIARTLGAKEEAETWLRAGHARRLAGDASDGVPADARERTKRPPPSRGRGLDELAARARNGAEGKAGAAEMIDGG